MPVDENTVDLSSYEDDTEAESTEPTAPPRPSDVAGILARKLNPLAPKDAYILCSHLIHWCDYLERTKLSLEADLVVFFSGPDTSEEDRAAHQQRTIDLISLLPLVELCAIAAANVGVSVRLLHEYLNISRTWSNIVYVETVEGEAIEVRTREPRFTLVAEPIADPRPTLRKVQRTIRQQAWLRKLNREWLPQSAESSKSTRAEDEKLSKPRNLSAPMSQKQIATILKYPSVDALQIADSSHRAKHDGEELLVTCYQANGKVHRVRKQINKDALSGDDLISVNAAEQAMAMRPRNKKRAKLGRVGASTL